MTDRYRAVLAEVKLSAEKAGRRPDEITVVAVSKQRTVEEIQALYDAGCRDFGENRLPEALEKQAALPKDIRWHFIGTLQSKKATKALGHFSLIHSVDTPKLALKLPGEKILLQVNVTGEESKHGLSPEEWLHEIESLKDLSLQGLMTMAPLGASEKELHKTFAALRSFRDTLEIHCGLNLPLLSMGMSGDYRIAIEEGATHVRIGSALFP